MCRTRILNPEIKKFYQSSYMTKKIHICIAKIINFIISNIKNEFAISVEEMFTIFIYFDIEN